MDVYIPTIALLSFIPLYNTPMGVDPHHIYQSKITPKCQGPFAQETRK